MTVLNLCSKQVQDSSKSLFQTSAKYMTVRMMQLNSEVLESKIWTRTPNFNYLNVETYLKDKFVMQEIYIISVISFFRGAGQRWKIPRISERLKLTDFCVIQSKHSTALLIMVISISSLHLKLIHLSLGNNLMLKIKSHTPTHLH